VTPNVRLLRRTLKFIKDHPKAWNQDQWWKRDPEFRPLAEVAPDLPKRITKVVGQCNSAGCFAGWAATFAGWLPDASFVERRTEAGYEQEATGNCEKDGMRDTYEGAASDELGLTDHQARMLFHASNTLEDLEEFVDLIAKGDDLLRFER
jgi:hypothetical protein